MSLVVGVWLVSCSSHLIFFFGIGKGQHTKPALHLAYSSKKQESSQPPQQAAISSQHQSKTAEPYQGKEKSGSSLESRQREQVGE